MVCGEKRENRSRYKTRRDITGMLANRSQEQCDVIEGGAVRRERGVQIFGRHMFGFFSFASYIFTLIV